MNNLTNIDTLTTEILMLKQQTAQNIIEIGKRLTQVKDSLGHGEWLPWLEQKVQFNRVTAWKFMKAAKEFSNVSAIKHLDSTKVLALLDLPSEDREEFTSTSHELPSGETKTVDEMTTRELQAAIKAKKEAEQKLSNAQSQVTSLASDLEEFAEENQLLREENLKLASKPVEVLEKIVEPNDYKDIKRELAEKNDRLLSMTKAAVRATNYQTARESINDMLRELGKSIVKVEYDVRVALVDGNEIIKDVDNLMDTLSSYVEKIEKLKVGGDIIDVSHTVEPAETLLKRIK